MKERNDGISFQALQVAPSAISEKESSNQLLESGNDESLSQGYNDSAVLKPCGPTSLQQSEDRSGHSSGRISMYSRFPDCAQTFVDALKSNRSCQRFIRAKLIEIEAKIERNKELKRRAKCLMDFQVVSGKRMNQALCQKRDPRVRLISLPKQRHSFSLKVFIILVMIGLMNSLIVVYLLELFTSALMYSKVNSSNAYAFFSSDT